MYNDLAKVYDAFTYDFDYKKWYEWYASIIKKLNPAYKEICDCGCGTGPLSLRFYKAGCKVTGVDLSEEMLRAAAEKARKLGARIPFVRQDMRELTLTHKVDAVLCACDGVNYLTTMGDVKRFFESAKACLKDCGVLAFDVSNMEKLSSMGKTGFFGEDKEDMAYLWMNAYDESTSLITMDLTFFVKDENGKFDRFTEHHVQRAHRKDELTALLTECGYTDITVYGGDSGESGGPGGKRMYIACKKA